MLTAIELVAFVALVVGATIAHGFGGALTAVAAVALIVCNEIERDGR